jgi:hypothetical protein
VNINKDEITKLLESQGNHDQAKKAGQQLRDAGTGWPRRVLSRFTVRALRSLAGPDHPRSSWYRP